MASVMKKSRQRRAMEQRTREAEAHRAAAAEENADSKRLIAKAEKAEAEVETLKKRIGVSYGN